MSRLIDQEENFAGNFGAAFRSSAIFYKPNGIKTTISLSNYWSFKNNLDVTLLFSTRDLKGNLISREVLDFQSGNILNFSVDKLEEGSIEVEAFSSKNLRIPYAAIMCVYEDENSISMVHSYSRNHSLIELEDDNAIVVGRESCWTVRGASSIRNCAVFHNGHLEIPSQIGKLIITNVEGCDFEYSFKLPRLNAFETYLFEIDSVVPNLKKVLKDDIGWATVHFLSKSSFTRLLVIWQDVQRKEFQVTHSNFDYTSHKTNHVTSAKPAYMTLPKVNGVLPSVIVYPKFSSGTYTLNGTKKFKSGLVYVTNSKKLTFEGNGKELPARIVTAITGKSSDSASLPYECSLGVVHEKCPPKRFHWFLVSGEHETLIHITSYSEIYPCDNVQINLCFRLYLPNSKEVLEKTFVYGSLEEIPSEIEAKELFDLSVFNGFACISLFSHFGGFVVYSSLKKNNSMTLEHSF